MINQKSIAVLPFENLSSDQDNEYFSDGISEEIINALSRINGLKVTARTSSFMFKNKKVDVRHIGNELGVATVLEGSVRKAGSRIRVTAQLIRTDSGFHIWSENFDRQLVDIFELQDEISLLIADKVRENFGHIDIEDHLVQASTENVDAYNLYLKARYNHLKWDGPGIRTGIELYEQSIATDPKFSQAYFGVGFCYAMFGSWGTMPEMLDVSDKYLDQGFELDDNSSMGYFARATLLFWGRWDVVNAVKYYNKAIELNPSHTEAEEGLAELYTAIGQLDRALDHVKSILRLNPLSVNHHFSKANIYYLQGRFEETLEVANYALQLDPGFLHAVGLKQLCLIHLDRLDELEAYIEATPTAEVPKGCRALYYLMYPNSGINFTMEEVEEVMATDFGITIFPWKLFLLVQLDRLDEAMEVLKPAVDLRRGQYIHFKTTPLLEKLRGRKDFRALVNSTFHNQPVLPSPQLKPKLVMVDKDLISQEDVTTYIEQLTHLMEADKVYLDTSLTLRGLADDLKLHPNKLSWLLNKHQQKNFNEFVNGYRIEAFKTMALQPANKHLTLLGIAYECGFNSKSVFNDFFKKSTGATPKAWVKQHS